MKKDRINVAAIIVLTLIISGLSLQFLPAFPMEEEGIDSERYDAIAVNLINGEGFTFLGEPSDEAPGYPFFLAGIYYFFGHNYAAVKFIQFLLLGGIAIIAYLICRKMFNFPPYLAFFSSLTILIWPYFILYSTLIVSEILFIFLLFLSSYFLLVFSKEPSLKNSLISGGILGAATLVRAPSLALPFWLAFLLLIFFKQNRTKTYFAKWAIISAVFILVLVPWSVRNYFQFHQIIPISPHLQSVLTKGYLILDYTEGSQALGPGEADFKTMALARLKNIYLFWNPGAGGTHAKTLQETFPIMGVLFTTYRIFFLAMLALAFWSLKEIRRSKEIAFLWIVIFYFWALHTMLYPYPRYTLPVIPLIIILAWFSLRNIRYKIGKKT